MSSANSTGYLPHEVYHPYEPRFYPWEELVIQILDDNTQSNYVLCGFKIMDSDQAYEEMVTYIKREQPSMQRMRFLWENNLTELSQEDLARFKKYEVLELMKAKINKTQKEDPTPHLRLYNYET